MRAPLEQYVTLESGDRLSREEFHRRYELRPDIKKAELVGGVVYVPSPVRYEFHSRQHRLAIIWLDTYADAHAGIEIAVDTTFEISPEDEVQPDIALFRFDGGQTAVQKTVKGYLEGGPEFVIEIAASSASYDLHDKKETYRRAGVGEYIVWRVLDAAIDWFRLEGGVYIRVEPDARGMIESHQFPGLRLDVAAMIRLDRRAVLAALTSG